MKRWPTKPLGGLITIAKGKKVSEVFAAPTKTSLRYLQIEDLRRNPTIKYCEPFNCPRATKSDVIIAWDGANAGTVSCNLDGHIGSTLAILRPIAAATLSAPFLSRFLQGNFAYLQTTATGATIPHVSIGALAALRLSLPPLVEQERIVKLLDEADDLRELRAQADRHAAALIPAIFHEMFGDPATNSKHWPVRPVSELIEACDYGTSQKANEEGRGVPVLRMGNVTSEGLLDLENLKTVELPEKEIARQRLRAGDILFNRTNSRELVGKTGMWDGRFEAVPASYFIRVRFRTNVEHPQHFTTFMNLPIMKRRLAEMARGAVGQANINSRELKSIIVPVPPFASQKEFAQRVTDIRELETDQTTSRTRLDTLFQSMLHRAFNGQL
jgi:type I restriction enzyme S subunit